MKVAIGMVCTNVALNLVLIGPLGLRGLALATSISGMVGLVLLVIMLKARLGAVGGSQILKSLIKIVLASAAMGVVAVYVARITQDLAIDIWGKLIQVFASTLAGLAVYVGLAFALKIKEIIFVLEIVINKVRKQ